MSLDTEPLRVQLYAKECMRWLCIAHELIIPATPYKALNMRCFMHLLNCQTLQSLNASNSQYEIWLCECIV